MRNLIGPLIVALAAVQAAPVVAAEIEAPAALAQGKWYVMIIQNPEQPKPRIAIWKLDADFRIHLEIACQDGAPVVRVSMNTVLPTYRPREATYTFDGKEAVVAQWEQDIGLPPVTTTLVAPRAQQAALLDGIANSDRLIFSTMTATGRLAGTFDLANGNEAVAFMRENCPKTTQ